MKKNFLVMAMVVAMMIPGFQLRVEAEEGVVSEASTDEVLTLEVLQQFQSWDELVNAVIPIDGNYNKVKNNEDFDCIWLIDTINKSTEKSSYSFSRTMLHFEAFDFDRLMQKYQTIIDCYNRSNEIQLGWNSEKIDETSFTINVYTESIHFVEKIIEEATSWEEVMRKMSPMLGSYSYFESHEDFCCALVLDGVDRIVTDPMYPDVSLSFKVELKDSDFEELNEKFLKIAELYNASNQLPIELEAKKISDEEFEVNIGFDVTKPVVTIGQNAIVRADRKFWEKPSMTGSYGNTSNLEIKMVTVNGVAYVDEKGNVLESYYKPYNQISDKELVIDDRPHMLHICTENTDLGWISEYDVVGIDY